MMEKGRNVEKTTLEQVKKNKKIKIILAFGLSKAGKTTLIKRLMGYTMEKTIIDGIYTIQAAKGQVIKE
jgi:GTPase SAR1 family protein